MTIAHPVAHSFADEGDPAMTDYYAPKPAEPGANPLDGACGDAYQTGDWGPWILDADKKSLVCPVNGNYPIRLEEVARPTRLAETLRHISRKSWPNEVFGGLIRAISDILNFKEANQMEIDDVCQRAVSRWPAAWPLDDRFHQPRFEVGWTHGKTEAKPTVVVDWVYDEQVNIKVGDTTVTSVNHDEHGWDGMRAAIDTAQGIAAALGARVEVHGTPNL